MRLLPAALTAALVLACGQQAQPVRLTESWPAQSGDYEDVTEAWTRKAVLRGEYQQALEVYATFRSPEWRAARAAREAEIRRLDGSARDNLMAEARTAAAGDYEVTMVVTTYERSENDLHRGERSVWRVALVDDAGKETPPSTVVRDRRPYEVLRAELPMLGDFATVYVATFPRTAAVLRDGAQRVALKIWGARGGVELVWTAR